MDPMHLNEVDVLDFLTNMFTSGESYSAINSARSALSAILCNDNGLTIGKFNSVKRFMKGVFERRPPTPRYDSIWDANLVLDFLKTFPDFSELSLRMLTYKLIMLLALASAQRAQTLHAIDISCIKFYDGLVEIPIYSLLKQTTVRNRKFSMKLKAYHDRSLCAVSALRCYLERTKTIRKNEKQLFISFLKPHKKVAKATISRWLKKVLADAGIDVSKFRAHSTRAASVSKFKKDNVNINDILKTAGWSNDKTF